MLLVTRTHLEFCAFGSTPGTSASKRLFLASADIFPMQTFSVWSCTFLLTRLSVSALDKLWLGAPPLSWALGESPAFDSLKLGGRSTARLQEGPSEVCRVSKRTPRPSGLPHQGRTHVCCPCLLPGFLLSLILVFPVLSHLQAQLPRPCLLLLNSFSAGCCFVSFAGSLLSTVFSLIALFHGLPDYSSQDAHSPWVTAKETPG